VSTKTLGPYHVRMRRISQSRVRVHMQLQTRFSPVSGGAYFISYPISSAYINRPTPPHLRRRKYTKGAARLLLPCGGAASLLRAHTHETRRHTTNAASCRYHQKKTPPGVALAWRRPKKREAWQAAARTHIRQAAALACAHLLHRYGKMLRGCRDADAAASK
jgi:hypothetical protein